MNYIHSNLPAAKPLRNNGYSGINNYLSFEIMNWNEMIRHIPEQGIETLDVIGNYCSHMLKEVSSLAIPETISSFSDVDLFQAHTQKFRLTRMLFNVHDAVANQKEHYRKLSESDFDLPVGAMLS